MTRFLSKGIAWYLVVAMFVIGITPRVYAGFVPSGTIGLSPAARTADLEKVQKFLEPAERRAGSPAGPQSG
jgi:hypothetical protein